MLYLSIIYYAFLSNIASAISDSSRFRNFAHLLSTDCHKYLSAIQICLDIRGFYMRLLVGETTRSSTFGLQRGMRHRIIMTISELYVRRSAYKNIQTIRERPHENKMIVRSTQIE
jgi:hypothetical protein